MNTVGKLLPRPAEQPLGNAVGRGLVTQPFQLGEVPGNGAEAFKLLYRGNHVGHHDAPSG